MHGYVDSIHVPLHLPPAAFQPNLNSSTSQSQKGKQKATTSTQSGGAQSSYNVVDNWNQDDRQQVERMLKMASFLGYSTIVLNITIPPTFDPSLLSFPTPLFPTLDPRTAPSGTSNLVLQLWKITVSDYSDEAVKGAGQKGWYGFANSTAPLYPPSTSILGVTPTTLNSFSHVALSLSPPSAHAPTLITLDPSLSPRLPFPLKRGLISTLVRSGVAFELTLRGITRQDLPGEAPGEAGKRRRNWIAGAREVVRATEGKGVVVSSGARSASEMRGSQDLINLCSLIGMPPSQAKDALTVNPQRAIMRGLSMRSTYRGVLSNPVLEITSCSPSNPITPSTTTILPKKRSATTATITEEEVNVGEGDKVGEERKSKSGLVEEKGGNKGNKKKRKA